MDETPVRLLNLIRTPDADCEAVESALTRLAEIARGLGHATRAELMRDVNDACRFVMLLEFASEERMTGYFEDPERLAVLRLLPGGLHQDIQRFELAPVEPHTHA